ncbi:hypothetical protein GCM10023093_03020 [Nemorincola caseinilytica]|uniref:Uncharacterized protein n=1 Tax=Nemorincola caseinilytica TaxID=2054315 RepID=A0ABP8N613_9BACT
MNKIAGILMIGMLWLAGSSCHRKIMQPKKDIVYNESAQTTTYTEAPYGSLVIPGRWEAGKYTKGSGHQYLYRADTSTLVAAIGSCRSLPFGKQQLQGYAVVERYYELEKKYQDMQGQSTKLIVADSAKKYMLWKAHIDGIDQYFLFGVKDGDECAYRYLNLKTRKMTADVSIQYLRDIFLDSK